MNRLSPLDTMFLAFERRHAPFHVGALSLFRPPKGAPPDFGAQLAGRLNQSSRASPPFDRRLITRFGVGFWEKDPYFDLDHHFIHLALPKPGRVRDLPAMVSREHSTHLDRAYPLWRTYLIDGLEGGRIATYSKIHHSVVDGVAGIRLMLKSMSPDPQASLEMPAPWELKPVRTRPVAAISALGAGLNTRFLDLASKGLDLADLVPAVYKQLKLAAWDLWARNPDVVSSLQAPRCLFNQRITGARQFATQSYSRARIRAVGAQLGGCTNDVALALCSAALRRYLSDQGALPDKPLIAAVPVSIRQDDSEAGNAVAGALVNLATHLADPVKRFNAIKASMDYNKARFRQMTPAQQFAYCATMLAPGLLTLLPGAQHTVANVVISHVPGPSQPMYWQGCQLEGIYPASLLLDGFALNITFISRHDTVDFGLLACRHTVPHMQRLLDYLEDALVELESATRAASARGAALAGFQVPEIFKDLAGDPATAVPLPVSTLRKKTHRPPAAASAAARSVAAQRPRIPPG